MSTIRVLLADDHAVVREGLKRLLEAQADLQVVGEATNGTEVLEQAATLAPDVVVMDVSMSPVPGPQATRELRQRCPNTKVLALTVHEDRSYVHEMLEAGAAGYVLKRSTGEELVGAIRSVATKGIYVDPRIARTLFSAFGPKGGSSLHPKADLSDRETEVLRLIAQGFTNKEISVQLGVSVKTVETYKARSMEKLGLRSRVDIVRTATARGWLNAR